MGSSSKASTRFRRWRRRRGSCRSSIAERSALALATLFCAAAALTAGCAHERARGGEKEEVSLPRSHVVAAGETAFSIARRYGVTVEALAAANGLADARALRAGQRLLIPSSLAQRAARERGEKTEPDDEEIPPGLDTTLRPRINPSLGPNATGSSTAAASDAVRSGASAASAGAAPRGRSPEAGTAPFIWPVDGVVISLFGQREGMRHDGVDIAAKEGAPIWASADGEVLFAGEQPGFGNLIILAHPGDLVTIYAHNQVNLADKGARVRQGDPIATVGQTGDAASPAVHFEIREGKKAINPLSRLPD